MSNTKEMDVLEQTYLDQVSNASEKDNDDAELDEDMEEDDDLDEDDLDEDEMEEDDDAEFKEKLDTEFPLSGGETD